MALVEFDADELARLRQEHATAVPTHKVFSAILSNPKLRQNALRMVKEVAPGTPIPEIDALDTGLSAIDPVKKELDDLKKQLKEEKEAAKKSSRETDAKKFEEDAHRFFRQKGYDDDGIKAVEKFMEKRGLIDYEAAEALFNQTQIPDEPIIPSNYGKNWDFFVPKDKNDPILEIMKIANPTQRERSLRRWSETEARDTLNEIRNAGRAA